MGRNGILFHPLRVTWSARPLEKFVSVKRKSCVAFFCRDFAKIILKKVFFLETVAKTQTSFGDCFLEDAWVQIEEKQSSGNGCYPARDGEFALTRNL